jgi:MinD-like ATPase involved in chromosome partitioning or flagellar assembly
MALTSAASRPTLLVDADQGGGGHDLLLGIERADGRRWPSLRPDDAAGLLASLPRVGGLRVLSCAPAERVAPGADEAAAVVAAALTDVDVVVADAPREASPVTARLASMARLAVVVVPAEVRAATAAAAVVGRLRDHCDDVRLVVRHPGPADLRVADVADVAGASVAAVWPWDRRLARLVDTGQLASAWRRTSGAAPARQLDVELGAEAA